MANWYVSSVAYSAVTAWASGVSKTVGSYIRPTAPTVGNERVYKATSVSGTHVTGGAEPTWPLTSGSTVTDNAGANQIVWTEVTGTEANQSAGSWTAPSARLFLIAGNSAPRASSGDQVFVSSDHAETATTTALAIFSASGMKVFSVSRAGASLPPTTTDLLAGGTIQTASANNIQLASGSGGNSYYWGLTFQAGNNSSSAANIVFGGNSSTVLLDNAVLQLNSTSGSSLIQIGSNVAGTTAYWNNTQVKFGAAGQGILPAGAGSLDWANTVSAVQGTAPTNLILTATTATAQTRMFIHGVDVSGVTGTLVQAQSTAEPQIRFVDCKTNSAVTFYGNGTDTAVADDDTGFVAFDNCDDTTSGTNTKFRRHYLRGSVLSSTNVARTGGASDGVTAMSHKMTTGAASNAWTPLIGMPMVKRYNSITSPASLVTATFYFIVNGASALTNAQIWAELEALTTAGVPLSTIATGRVADLLAGTTAAAWSADTSAWNSVAAARQNSHAYVVGDAIAVSDAAAGTVWFCTTAGTTAGSEPGGYSGATDGTSVTDGGAVFRAGQRQKLTVQFTPQVQGDVYAAIKLAVASTTVYVDPKLNIA